MVPRHRHQAGPDGGVYVSDWTDTGECHNYDKVDATNGRIYKVTYGTPKPWRGDVSRLSDAELVKLQSHKNDWFARHARRVLQERAAAGKLDPRTPAHLDGPAETPPTPSIGCGSPGPSTRSASRGPGRPTRRR